MTNSSISFSNGIQFKEHNIIVGPDKTTIFGPMSQSISFGKSVAITGPSGCGKTSLLRQLVDKCIEEYSNKNLNNVTWDYLGQKDFLFPWYSALRNLEALTCKGIGNTDTAKQIAVDLEIQHVLNNAYSSLSGGEKQRVGLWTLLCREPKVILIDEPFTALDFGMKMRALLLLSNYASSPDVTAIIVSHDIDIMSCFSDEIWYMDDIKNEIKILPNIPIKNFNIEEYQKNRVPHELSILFSTLINNKF